VVILDTNLLIDFIHRPNLADSELEKFLKENPQTDLSISVITIQELYVGQSSKDPKKEQMFLNLIKSLRVLPYELKTAKLAGEIIRDSKTSLSFPDAAIAATTILSKAKLLTLNKKDYEKIKKLKLI